MKKTQVSTTAKTKALTTKLESTNPNADTITGAQMVQHWGYCPDFLVKGYCAVLECPYSHEEKDDPEFLSLLAELRAKHLHSILPGEADPLAKDFKTFEEEDLQFLLHKVSKELKQQHGIYEIEVGKGFRCRVREGMEVDNLVLPGEITDVFVEKLPESMLNIFSKNPDIMSCKVNDNKTFVYFKRPEEAKFYIEKIAKFGGETRTVNYGSLDSFSQTVNADLRMRYYRGCTLSGTIFFGGESDVVDLIEESEKSIDLGEEGTLFSLSLPPHTLSCLYTPSRYKLRVQITNLSPFCDIYFLTNIVEAVPGYKKCLVHKQPVDKYTEREELKLVCVGMNESNSIYEIEPAYLKGGDITYRGTTQIQNPSDVYFDNLDSQLVHECLMDTAIMYFPISKLFMGKFTKLLEEEKDIYGPQLGLDQIRGPKAPTFHFERLLSYSKRIQTGGAQEDFVQAYFNQLFDDLKIGAEDPEMKVTRKPTLTQDSEYLVFNCYGCQNYFNIFEFCSQTLDGQELTFFDQSDILVVSQPFIQEKAMEICKKNKIFVKFMKETDIKFVIFGPPKLVNTSIIEILSLINTEKDTNFVEVEITTKCRVAILRQMLLANYNVPSFFSLNSGILSVYATPDQHEKIKVEIENFLKEHGVKRVALRDKKPGGPIKCGICLIEIDPNSTEKTEEHFTLDCEHSFHIDCMSMQKDYELLPNSQLPIKCSECTQPIKAKDLVKVFTKEEMHMLARKGIGMHVDQNSEEYSWCPSPDCLFPMRYEFTEQPTVEESKEEKKEEERKGPKQVAKSVIYKCPGCSIERCKGCGLPWHRGMSCLQFRKVEEAKSLNKFVSSWVKQRNVKKCPKCQKLIQKDGGCSHVQCAYCKIHFCWKCAKFHSKNADKIYYHMEAKHGE